MTLARPAADWVPARPFWRALGTAGVRALAVDVPMTLSVEPFDGVEIAGWASHDQLAPPASHPAAELAAARRSFGRSPLGDEVFGPQAPAALLALRDELITATGATAEVAERLLRREPWDLALVVLGATHRGGHKLWDLSGVRGEAGPHAAELRDALRRVYVACDDATRRLVEAAGPDAATVVFSVHGMGANTSRADLLPAMLARVLDDGAGAAPAPEAGSRGLLGRLRSMAPLELRNTVKSRLPQGLQDRLTTFWRLRGNRVETARVLPLMADLQGYLRINLRGRETPGLVEPGAEEEALSRRVSEGISDFVDADSGEPVVREVVRSRDVFPPGACLRDLPDLLVLWSDTPAAGHRLLTSPRFGEVAWPDPGRNPDGRSGNHRPEGFVIVAGGGATPGSRLEGDVRDLAPTACSLLGIDPPWPMEGRALLPAGSAAPSNGGEHDSRAG
jgi:predicted AlkP superfamily phosphohydrolase/phosphomutase